jgi:hypothetical protein
MRILLSFAHFGEAQAFIQGLSLKPVSSNLFFGEDWHLVLTGEGHHRALVKSLKQLAAHSYSAVIQIGVCGAIHPAIEIERVYQIHTVYHFFEGLLDSKSFTSTFEINGLPVADLVSASERWHSIDAHHPIRAFVELVDRESWSVAYAAHEMGLPFFSFKVVSDRVAFGEVSPFHPCERVIPCDRVIRDAAKFSEIAFRTFQSFCHQLTACLGVKNSKSSELRLDPEDLGWTSEDWYWTFTQRKKFERLIRILGQRFRALELETNSECNFKDKPKDDLKGLLERVKQYLLKEERAFKDQWLERDQLLSDQMNPKKLNPKRLTAKKLTEARLSFFESRL